MSAQRLEQIEQLQATLSKMELTLEAIADAVVWVGADEVVQWCNSSFERLVNRLKSEILGSRFSELLPLWQAENPVKLELYPHTRIHQGNYTPTEYKLRQTDNSLVLHISGTLADITREKSAILIIKDITQQKDKSLEIIERNRAKEALHRSNAILQAQQEAAVDGILIIDENGKVISYNQRFVDLWQIPAAVIQTEDDSQLLASVIHQLENPEEFLAKIEYLYQHPEEISRDEISLKAGKIFDRYSAPVCSSLENYFGRIWYFRDITERRLAEEALQASEARLNTILNSTLAAICRIRVYTNGEWHFEYCSPGGVKIWDLTPEEIIADKNLLTSRIIPEDLENILQKGLQEIFDEQACELEYRYLHPDGKLRWINVKLISARDETTDSWLATFITTDITEKKLAEEALKASEARLNTILNSALAVIFYARLYPNREWDIEYCSPGSLEIWGYTPEQIIADKNLYLSNIFPEDLENVYQPALDACLAEQNYETEYRYLHPDGSLRWNFFNLTSVHDKAAGCWRATIVSTDITNQKRAEEALKASEARLNTILNSASAVIQYIRFHPNREWDSEYCSPRSLELWGYTPEEIIADKNLYFSRVLPEDLQKLYEPAVDAILAEQDFEAEYRYLHPDGSLRWLFFKVTSVRDEVADCWRATFVANDITERKRAEQVQQRRAQAENILSNISRHFLDQNLDTAINFTLEEIANFINAERSCIYTYSENQQECYLLYEWCAENIEPMAEITRSITVEKFPGIHQQMFQGKAVQFASKTEISQNTTELKILTASAIKSVMIVPMMHADTVVGLLCFNTVSKSKIWSQEDINFLKLVGELIAMGRARHEAEAALTLAKEAAEAANRAKSMFLANMSHELRTPLNAILGFAQLMERDRTLNPKQQESLATINRSGEHLLNLIDDVLEMSKIEAGRVVLHSESFDLLALLRIIQEMFLVRTQAKQLFLKVEIAPDVPRYVDTDEGKLRQVLINLLGNAVKFTVNGGIILRVKPGTRDWELESTNKNTQSLIFEIEDTGCGIAPEEMKNLFKPFVQTSSGIHLKSGTGLGLTISREFIRLMGGEIHARSIFGQGSSFSFNIQVNVSASSQVAIQLNSRRVVQLAANHSSVRILVVDDIPENCDLIAQLLSSTGFAVQIAVNGKQAISQWQTWQPHLIFMDMRMPVMDGYEATRVIRAREREIQHHNNSVPDPRTIIIALTASAFKEQRATIIAAGCDDLVRKPFKEQVIFDKIAEYLNVNYIYADEPSNYSETQDLLMNQGRNNKITSGDLAKIMPQEWLLQLRQAALEVDGDRILQLISEIPSIYADSANELIRLVRQFCFDEILELTELNTLC